MFDIPVLPLKCCIEFQNETGSHRLNAVTFEFKRWKPKNSEWK